MELIATIKSHLTHAFEEMTVEQIRQAQVNSKLNEFPPLQGFTAEKVQVAHLPAEWVKADNVADGDDRVILYFHGGGFISGSCDTHRDLTARISQASGVRVLLVEYRLAPEHPYPAANEDCLTAYGWLIANGVSPNRIILGGDSTGGTLVLMTLLSLREAGDPLPAGAFLISPHTDLLYFDGESYTSRAALDPMGSRKGAQLSAEYYLGTSPDKPAILSPLHQNLAGLPSLFLQIGEEEVLYSEVVDFAERAKDAGVVVTLEVWDHVWHLFQLFAAILPEAQQAIDRIGEFVREQL
jgi:acetyl esterase/lipase